VFFISPFTGRCMFSAKEAIFVPILTRVPLFINRNSRYSLLSSLLLFPEKAMDVSSKEITGLASTMVEFETKVSKHPQMVRLQYVTLINLMLINLLPFRQSKIEH
jgi:hypothetical protein